MGHRLVLLPKNVPGDEIKRLSDVGRLGGKIIFPAGISMTFPDKT